MEYIKGGQYAGVQLFIFGSIRIK